MAKDVNELISYLQSNPVKGKSAGMASGANDARAINWQLPLQNAASGSSISDAIVGPLNLFGGFMRGVTSIGRGVTNLAYGTLPGANEAYRIAKDGVTPDEIGSYAGAISNAIWGGLKGLTAGIGYSFATPDASTRRKYEEVFGFKPLEGGYDLFKSDEFKQASENLPFLKGATDDSALFTTSAPGISIPFLGIDKDTGMPITSAGLYSFAWDVLTDPVSFMTLGIGGAAKGTVSGISKATQAAMKKPAAQTAARPFYGPKEVRRQPLTGDAAYNAADTNPFVFIAKETGRGFVEAHKNVLNISRAKRAARLDKKNGLSIHDGAVASLAAKGVDAGENPQALLTEIESIGAERLAEYQKSKVASESVKSKVDPAIEQAAAGDAIARAVLLAKREVEFAPERRARIAELVKGMDPEAAKVAIRADEVRRLAGTIKNRVKLVRETEAPRYEPELTRQLADNLTAAHGTDAPNVAPAITQFITEARARDNKGAIEEMLNYFFAPVGYRERYRGTKLEEDKLAVKQMKKRTPSQSKEIDKLMGLVKSDLTRINPKASTNKSVQGADKVTAPDILDAIESFVTRFTDGRHTAEMYESGFIKEIADQVFDMPESELAKFAADMSKALDGSTRVFAQRMYYGVERDIARPSAARVLLDRLSDDKRGYNPFRPNIDATIVAGLGKAATRNRARLINLATAAGSDAYSAEVSSILRKAGVKGLYASADLFTDAVEAIHAIVFLKATKRKQDITLKAFNTKLGKLSLSEKMAPELRIATDEQWAGITRRAAEIAPNGARITDEELDALLNALGGLKDRQLDALATVTSDFGIPRFGVGSELLELGSTNLELARKIGARRLERYAPTKAADEIGKIKGAFNDVQKDIGVDSDGNVKFGETLKEIAKSITTQEGRSLLATLGEIVFKKNVVTGRRTAIKIPATNAQLVSEVKREIGNAIAKAEKALPREGVPGFTDVFTGLSGEFRTGTLSDFMAGAYAASRRADSPDGGRFADYIEEVFLAERVDAPEWTSATTVSAKAKVLSSYANKWSGEALTPGLLQHMVAVYSKPGKTTSSAKEIAGFISNVKTIRQRLVDFAKMYLSEIDEFKTFDSSAGWLRSDINSLKKGESQLTLEELGAARDAFFGVETGEIPEELWRSITSDLEELGEAVMEGAEFAEELLKSAGLYRSPHPRIKETITLKNGRTKENPAYIQAQLDGLKSLRDLIRGPRVLTGKVLFAISRGGVEFGALKSGAFRRIVEELLGLAQRKAEAAVVARRSSTFFDTTWPSTANELALKTLPEKMSIGQAYMAMQAEMLLSKTTSSIDARILQKQADKIRRLPRGDAASVKKDVARLTRVINELDRKLNKLGYPQMTPAKVAGMTYAEVKQLNNPRAILAKMWAMETRTPKELADWQDALAQIAKIDDVGDKVPFYGKSGVELIRAWEDGAPEVSDEIIQKVIAKYGYIKAQTYLNRGKQARKDTLIKWVKDAKELIDAAELERARLQNIFVDVGLMADDAAEVKAAMDAIPVPEVHRMIAELKGELANLVAVAQQNGVDWLPNLAMGSFGEGTHLFFRLVAEASEGGTAALPRKGVKVQYRGEEVPVKQTKEIFGQYSEFNLVVDGVREYARTVFPENSMAQDTLTQQLTVMALRIKGLYSLLRGVTPAATTMLSRGGAEVKAIFSQAGIISELNDLIAQPIFLFDADVLEALPAELARDMLFLGREASIPYSAIMEGARVITAHMNRLKAGEWFDEEGLQAVYMHAYANMVAEGKRSFVSNSKTGGSLWWDLDAEQNSVRIRNFIDYMLSSSENGFEAPAFRLLEKHKQNQIYAMSIAKIQADGRIIGPIRDAWEKVVFSDIMSAGDKAEATAKAFDQLNEVLQINDVGQDIGEFLAGFDQIVAMASFLDRESIISTVGHRSAKESVDKILKAKGKKTTIQVEKEISAAKTEQLIKEQRARTDLILDKIAQTEMKLREIDFKPEHGEMVDLVNDAVTDGPKVNWILRTLDKAFTKFSYNYGMEEVRSVYGGITRNIIEMESHMTKSNVYFARKWADVAQQTGTNYPMLAMTRLEEAGVDNMTEILELLNDVRIGFNPKSNAITDPEVIDQVINSLTRLRELLGDDVDETMMSALADVAAPLRYLFGENGAFATQGGSIKLYNSFLSKIGASKLRFNQNLTTEGLKDAWRDLEWNEPFNTFNALHYAYAETERLQTMAAGTMDIVGARKINEFASLAEAEAQGFIKMNTVKEMRPDSGTELIYFMDTEDYLYPAALIGEIETFAKFVTLPYRGFGAGFANFMRRFSGIQDFAKQSMTTLRPGNHLMNTLGIFFANDMAGLRNPGHYVTGIQILKTIGVKETDMGLSLKGAEMAGERFYAEMAKDNARLKAGYHFKENSSTFWTTFNGKRVEIPHELLGTVFKRDGGIPPFQQTMNLDTLTEFGQMENLQKAVKSRGLKDAYRGLTDFAGNLAAGRDSAGRIALWLDVIRKGNWKDLNEASAEAMKVVNRYHPQAQDVSKMNYMVTRQAILFFTWRAKMLGTIIYDLLERPGRIAMYEKAYYNAQAAGGNAPEYFGSHDPEETPVRSFQQNTLGLLSGNNEYSYSVANPVWDLMGSDGWLSNIKWNSNESAAANALQIGLGTSGNVLYSSSPLIGNFLLNWANGRTQNGVDLMRGGITEEDMPLIVSEAATSFGLNAYHALAAYFFPGVVDKGSWKTMTPDQKTEDLLRTWFNWATGTRAQKYLTPDNQKKAWSELSSYLKVLNRRDVQKDVNSPAQSTSELLDYLQKNTGN